MLQEEEGLLQQLVKFIVEEFKHLCLELFDLLLNE